MSARRRVGVGLGVTGAGIVGGLAAERTLARRMCRNDPAAQDAALVPTPGGALSVTTGDGARLHVVDWRPAEPTGATVVLLHGVALSAAVWRYQLAELTAAGHRVVAFDQRGHGASSIGTDGLTLARLAGDLSEVILQLDLSGVVLAGHSMGGMVAMRFLAGEAAPATRQALGSAPLAGQDRVAALALVATTAGPVTGSGVPGARRLVAAAGPLAARASRLAVRIPGPTLPDIGLAFWVARLGFGKRPSAAQIHLTRQITAAIPARVSAELVLEILCFDQSETLADLSLPTTVVVGANDVLTPLRHARAMAEAIPDARLEVLEGCGHMVMLERHQRLSEIIKELASTSRPLARNRP